MILKENLIRVHIFALLPVSFLNYDFSLRYPNWFMVII